MIDFFLAVFEFPLLRFVLRWQFFLTPCICVGEVREQHLSLNCSV